MDANGGVADPATVFAGIAELIYAKADYDAVYQAVVDAGPQLVTGCDHASLMMLRGGAFETAASSDEVARHIDALEREVADGPCVDAILDEAYQLDDDITRQSAWPKLAELILRDTPVRGIAGHRIILDGSKIGALNLFSDTPGAMRPDVANEGVVLASFASVALGAVAHNERAESLQAGLTSNREIGKAIGLLMTAHQISSDEAFELLRKASADMNIKLARIAQEIVQHHDSRPRPQT